MIWGGKEDCQHDWVDSSIPKSGGVGDYEVGRVGNAIARTASHEKKESNCCSLCGAWRGSYGLEPTPEMYIEHTIEFLREIRRVLRKDGVVFWNIGDTYSATRWSGNEKGQPMNKFSDGYRDINPDRSGCNLPAKNLCLIPFRVAIEAQRDGWWVRSVIIWSKPNPMPESVTDRPTESHEYILMLTKSARYYWDAFAVRENQSLFTDTARATNWASLSGATIRIECSATLNTDNLPSNLRGWHSFHSLEPSINFTVAFHADKLEIGGMISGNVVLEYPEGQTMMNLKDCIVTRDATDFALITPFNSDEPSNDMPIPASIIDASTTPHTILFADQLTNHPLSDTSPTTKIVGWLHILQITPELFTAEITFDKSVAGSPFLIRCSFVSSHTNNIIPQKVRGYKRKGRGGNNSELGNRNFLPIQQEQHHGQDINSYPTGRNLRSVWTFPTQSFPSELKQSGQHFATFPEELVRRCVKAATPEVGCCSKCGKPWVRIIDKQIDGELKDNPYYGDDLLKNGKSTQGRYHSSLGQQEKITRDTLGWQPQCKCNADKVPSIVLDPFAGSGTTGWVAKRLNRRAILYELSEEYCALAVKRNEQQVLL